MREEGRHGPGTFVSAPRFAVGFFLRRGGLRITKTANFLHQFLQVTF